MAQQIFTCINCPIGCQLTVRLENGEVAEVSGNQCARGLSYAKQEAVRPLRMVTAVAPVEGSPVPISLKTESPIPKESIAPTMAAVRGLKLRLPIQMGQVLLKDVAGTGVDLIATKALP